MSESFSGGAFCALRVPHLSFGLVRFAIHSSYFHSPPPPVTNRITIPPTPLHPNPCLPQSDRNPWLSLLTLPPASRSALFFNAIFLYRIGDSPFLIGPAPSDATCGHYAILPRHALGIGVSFPLRPKPWGCVSPHSQAVFSKRPKAHSFFEKSDRRHGFPRHSCSRICLSTSSDRWGSQCSFPSQAEWV